MSENKRQFTRIEFDAHTSIHQNGRHWPVQLVDISLNGLLVKQPKEWAVNPGKPFIAEIRLDPDHGIRMEVELVHVTTEVVGFRCEHMDIESASELRRLVELNVGSDNLLQREFAALMTQHMKEE